jgi:molybdate transport system regulatory protein
LEAAEGVFFGMGREFLLQGIEEYGSLKKAAEAMGMSYRAAWGKIKSTEKILNISLIEKRGGNRSGYQVTPEGRKLMEKFDFWFNCVESEAIKLAEEIFPFEVKNFWERNNTF